MRETKVWKLWKFKFSTKRPSITTALRVTQRSGELQADNIPPNEIVCVSTLWPGVHPPFPVYRPTMFGMKVISYQEVGKYCFLPSRSRFEMYEDIIIRIRRG